VHAHHLSGPTAPSPDGYQFKLIGNAVDGGSTTYPFKWGIDIHASNYGLIQQNVVYNLSGSGIAFEVGAESFNVLDSNFVVRVFGAGGRSDSVPDLTVGANGRGIWARGPNNYIRNNVVANVTPVVDTYGYEIFTTYLGNIAIPNFIGADPLIASQWSIQDGNAMPILEFAGNEAYGALESGMTIWWIGAFGDTLRPGVGLSVIKDFHVWNVYTQGFWNYQMSNVLIDGFVARGDASNPGFAIGMYMDDYTSDQVVVRNADIQGMAVGIGVPVMFIGNPLFRIENSYFRNMVNISVPVQWSCCYWQLAPRQIVISGVRFDPMGTYPFRTISMDWFDDVTLAARMADLVQKTQVYVEDYNQRPGVNFQVFYLQQNPNQVVPQTIANFHTGSPEAGLTNQQNWAKYQIALAGGVAPCLDKSTYPEIIGYVCPGTYTGPSTPTVTQSSSGTGSSTPTTTTTTPTVTTQSVGSSSPPPATTPTVTNSGLPKPVIGYDSATKGFSYSGVTSDVAGVVVSYCEMSASGCSYGQSMSVGLMNPIPPRTLVPSTTGLLCAKVAFKDKTGGVGPQSDGQCVDPVPLLIGTPSTPTATGVPGQGRRVIQCGGDKMNRRCFVAWVS
jgi:hypothetical protein